MPQRVDHLVVGLALDAAVPGAIVIGSVAVGFAVRAVVFDVVGHEIAHREPVVCGDEVHARRGSPAVPIEDVGGADQPLRQLTHSSSVAPPEVADVVALRQLTHTRVLAPKVRMVRKRSFHSLQPGPKPPTW